MATRADQVVAAREGRAAGGVGQGAHHRAQPSPQTVPHHRRAGATGHGEGHPRRVAGAVEQIADLEQSMADDAAIPAEPFECRRGPDSPDQADNLWRPRRRLALTTARPPRLLIRFRNPCRRDRRRTFGWYVRFTSVPPCAGSTHPCRCSGNERVPRAGSSGLLPQGPSRPVVRTGDRTQLDRLTLRPHGDRHNRAISVHTGGVTKELQKSRRWSQMSASVANTLRTVRLDCPPRRTPQHRQADDQRDHSPSAPSRRRQGGPHQN